MTRYKYSNTYIDYDTYNKLYFNELDKGGLVNGTNSYNETPVYQKTFTNMQWKWITH